MRPSAGSTTRKLLLAFGALVALFAAASGFALGRLSDIHEGSRTLREAGGRVRDALELATAVRDEYAHLAHTVILGNASHVRFHSEARARVEALTRKLWDQAQDAEERAWVADIRESGDALDRLYRESLLPAVLAKDQGAVTAAHGHALEKVNIIQARADALASRFDASIGRFEDHVAAVERASFRWALLFLGGATLFAAGVGVYIGNSVARPVARLSEGAARLSQGDLRTRIPEDDPGELGQLAAQFNRMMEAVRTHQEQWVQHEKLAGIGRLAAGVAHEINNPLGVILGYVRLLQRKAEGGLAEDLKVVEEEAMRCQDIVEGLLDLSRPGRGPLERVPLREACEDVVGRLREAARLGDVRVSVEGEAAAWVQPPRLRQVLLNLVKNAAEAAGEGGSVEVRIEAGGDGATSVAVSDSGPGMTPEERARLFEPFFTTKPTGTGLGLAVSQAIAEAHGGRIEADTGPLGGARFTLRLPPPTRAQEALS
ncbi:histidine kinase [Corallococcus sp. H22C18031201]|uniref:sensor histidine kinase n=1 Tax=Citreicoccus inhibens TaxID=2849499 RepID=UPI000E742896|nr:sensor histidine kinase [Citreicoccus inhibens]MBU8896393.1 HAMP domain-containing protein [Citreicoccus inhibens]RJS24222.1 histidine kinase [Corallococcus sp. H22C18031201]